MQQTVMDDNTSSAVQPPMDGTLENGVNNISLSNATSSSTQSETPSATTSKTPLTYDEVSFHLSQF